MTIDPLGPVDPVHKPEQSQRANRSQQGPGKDSISFSDEAKLRGEVHKVAEQVRNSPDVRQDRIEEVRQKLEDPDYIDDRVLNTVADRLMELFEL